MALELSLAVPGRVLVSMFDVAGRRMETIATSEQSTGVYPRTWHVARVANGLYFIRMQAGGVWLTKTVLEIRWSVTVDDRLRVRSRGSVAAGPRGDFWGRSRAPGPRHRPDLAARSAD